MSGEKSNKGEFIISKEAMQLAFAPLLHIDIKDLWVCSVDFNLKTKASKVIFTDTSEVSLNAPFKVQTIKTMPVKLENDEDEDEITTVFLIELPAEETDHYNARSVNMLKVLMNMEFKACRVWFRKEFHAGKISRYYMNLKTDTGYVLNIKTLPVL